MGRGRGHGPCERRGWGLGSVRRKGRCHDPSGCARRHHAPRDGDPTWTSETSTLFATGWHAGPAGTRMLARTRPGSTRRSNSSGTCCAATPPWRRPVTGVRRTSRAVAGCARPDAGPPRPGRCGRPVTGGRSWGKVVAHEVTSRVRWLLRLGHCAGARTRAPASLAPPDADAAPRCESPRHPAVQPFRACSRTCAPSGARSRWRADRRGAFLAAPVRVATRASPHDLHPVLHRSRRAR